MMPQIKAPTQQGFEEPAAPGGSLDDALLRPPEACLVSKHLSEQSALRNGAPGGGGRAGGWASGRISVSTI